MQNFFIIIFSTITLILFAVYPSTLTLIAFGLALLTGVADAILAKRDTDRIAQLSARVEQLSEEMKTLRLRTR